MKPSHHALSAPEVAGADNFQLTPPTRSLRKSVEFALEAYFDHLDGQHTSELYQLVLQEVEVPLLEAVLSYTDNNQSRAAGMLGLNRGTLRKKLKQYNLL